MGQQMEINSLTINVRKTLCAYRTDKCNLVLFKYHKYNYTTLAFCSQIFNFKFVEFGVKFGM